MPPQQFGAGGAVRTLQLKVVVNAQGQQQLKAINVGLGNLNKSVAVTSAAFQRAEKTFKLTAGAGTELYKSLSNVRGTIVGLGTAMLTIGSIQIFTSSVREAIEFEAQMANVNSILKGSDVTIQQLTQQVVGMSGALGSSSEQANALYEALSAGVPAGKAIEFVTKTATLAKATLADLGDITKVVASIMNAYGKEAGSITHITDVLATTVDEGIIRGNELASAFENVLNTASVAKVPLEQVSSALATMTTVGISASEASTALNRALMSYIDPSKEAVKAVEAWNKAHKDAQIELSAHALQAKGLTRSLQDLVKATQGDVEITRIFFGEQRALKGILALTGEQMEAYIDRAERMAKASGTAQEMFEKQQKSLKEQFKTAVNNINKALEDLWQTLINKLTPALVEASNKFVNFVNQYKSGNFDHEINKITDNVKLFGIAWAGIKFFEIISNLKNTAIAMHGLALLNIGKFALATKDWGTAFGLLNTHLMTTIPLLTKLALVLVAVWSVGKVIELLRTVSELADENNKLAESEKNLRETLDAQSRKIYQESGGKYFIPTTGRSAEDVIKDIQRVRKEMNSMVNLPDTLGSSIVVFGEAIEEAGNSTGGAGEKFDEAAKALEKLKESFEEALHPTEAILDKISKLEGMGYDLHDILAVMSDDIIKAAESFWEMNGSIDPAIENMYTEALAAQKAKEATKEFIEIFSKGGVAPWKLEDMLFDITELESYKRAVEAYDNELKEMAQRELDVMKYSKPLNTVLEEFNLELVAAKHTMTDNNVVLKAWQDAIVNAAIEQIKLGASLKEIEAVLKLLVPAYAAVIMQMIRANLLMEIMGDNATDFAQAWLKAFASGASGFESIMSGIGNELTNLADTFEGTTKLMLKSAGTFATTFSDALKKGFDAAEAVALAGVASLNNIINSLLSGSKTGKWGSTQANIGASVGSIAGGAVGSIFGPIGTVIGSALGKAVGAFIGALFAHDWNKDVKKLTDKLGFQISKDLTEQIAKRAKEMGSALEAVLLSLDLIAEEVGVTSANLSTFIAQFTEALSTFTAGSKEALEVVEDLNKVFPDMLKAATNEFGELNSEMLVFIDNLQQAGIEVEALTDFLNTQSEKAANALNGLIERYGERVKTFAEDTEASIRKILEKTFEGKEEEDALKFFDKLVEKGVGVVRIFELIKQKYPDIDFTIMFTKFASGVISSKAEWRDFFTLLMADINEMIAQGVPLSEIFDQIGSSLQGLRDAAIELGLQGDPMFKSLMSFFRVMKSGAAKDLSDLNTLMTAFNNLGLMTKTNFASMQNIFSRVFKEFNKDGKISRAEMTAMLPTLAQMRENAAKYGFELNKDVQAMIDLAIKRGMLPEDMPIDPMTQFANVINDKLIPALDKMNGILEKIIGYDGTTIDIAANVTTGTDTFYNAGSPPSGYQGDIPTYAGITEPVLITQDEQVVKVHKGEYIMPSSENANRSSSGYMPDEVPVYVTVYNDTYIGEEKIDSRITTRMEKGFISPKQARQRLQRER